MNKTVTVIMSTYNGGLNIIRQLDSIFSQKGIDVKVLIRDDCSQDETVSIIKNYMNRHKERKIELIEGENEGYARSFMDALNLSGLSDYYAFSDQDDVWLDDKLIKTIKPMEESPEKGPKLSYCNMQRSNEQLECLSEQIQVLKPQQLTKKIVFTQSYNYGAATVFNHEARKLACRCKPQGYDIPHDFWLGLLCYWFGHVYYVDEELYYWIRYGTSVSGEGTKKSGMMYRIRESLKGKSYPNVSNELCNYYNDLITGEEAVFLNYVKTYKESNNSKRHLIFDSSFQRKTLRGTFALKIGILMNWY